MNQPLFIVLGISMLFYIIGKVRKKKFAEKDSLVWILSGLVVFLLAAFPQLLGFITKALGVVYQPTALFLMTFFAIMLILLGKEEQITSMNYKLKELSQKVALLEEKLRKSQKPTNE